LTPENAYGDNNNNDDDDNNNNNNNNNSHISIAPYGRNFRGADLFAQSTQG